MQKHELSQSDTKLAEAWDTFCDQLKEAGKIPFRDGVPKGDLSRAAGFRCLVQNIGLGVQFYLENDDPLHPELLHYFDPIRKQGGDNPDAVYVGGPINGTDTYRIHGNLGSAKYFAVTAVETGDTPWGGGVASTLFGQDLEVDEDGNFELICSPNPHPGNWLKTTPDTFRVTFRQFFADWETERPMHATIDRISPTGAPKPVMDTERLSKGLDAVSRWVGVSLNYWADMIEKWKEQPNRFLSYRQLDDNKIDATPGGEPLIMYWQLPADEAIVIRVKPPEAVYWAVEFGNYWWCSMDYRSILSNTNCHYAQLEDNGELVVVVSHTDTGHANWLDPAGFSEGYVTIRWMQADHYPTPIATQIKLTELDTMLPQAKKLTQEERAEQIARRRRGVIQRFGV